MKGKITMKTKDNKSFTIVINGNELPRDDLYKVLSHLKYKSKPIEKVYKDSINKLKKLERKYNNENKR